MKKIISLAVILCMLFSVTGSAFTVFKHTYNDVDGTIYHIGTFEEGDTDAGVIVNGKKYSLKSGIYMGDSANAWEEANGKQRRFALGLRTPAGFEGDSYSVAPYSVDAEGKIKVGQATTVHSGTTPGYAYKKIIADPVVADVKNGLNDDSNVSTGNIKQLTVKCDGLASGVSNHNMVLLAKLDIRELKKDYLPGSDIYFTLNGGYNSNWATSGIDNSLSEITIHVAGAPQVSQEWDEENAPAFVKEDGITAKSYYTEFGQYGIPMDSLVVSTAEENKGVMEDRTFNITGFIQQELAKGNDYASVAIWVDNYDAEAAYKANGGRNAYLFKILSRESGSPYKLTYTAVDNNIELKSLKVNEEEVAKYIDGNNTYTKYLPFGTTEIPVVSAEAVSENAKITVTQADSLNEKATVKITSADGSKNAEYTIQYVVSELPSQDTYKALGWNAGVVANGNNNVISMDEQTSGNAVLTYTDTVIRYQSGESSYKNFLATGKYLRLYNSPVARAGYVPAISLMQLDLTKLINTHKLEIGSPIELHIDGEFKTYDTAADANVNSVELQLYDMTGTDWTDINGKINTIKGEAENIAKYDYKVNNTEVLATAESTTDALRTLLRDTTVLKNKKMILSQNVPYGKYGLTTTSGSENNVYGNNRTFEENGFLKVDISEFVRYCVSTGNMTPTIGFYIAPCSSTVQNRQIGSIYYQGTGNMSYLKFGAEVELDEETLNSYKDASIHTLTVNGTEVDVRYIDPETNTYTAYLPAGTDLAPMVEATVNEKAKVEIEQAAMPDEDTVIKVTAYNGTVATYTVKSVVSEAESAQTYKALGWNSPAVANKGKNLFSANPSKTTGSSDANCLYLPGAVSTRLPGLSDTRPYLQFYNTPVANGGYAPNVALMQLDFNCLINEKADLSKPITLDMDGEAYCWDKANSGSTGASVSILDVTGIDWTDLDAKLAKVRAYDVSADATATVNAEAQTAADELKAYVRNISAFENKPVITTEFLEFGMYGCGESKGTEKNSYGTEYVLEANGFATFDISEFARYCISTGNMTPTVAFYVNPSSATVLDRHMVKFALYNTPNMSFIGYSK